MTRSGREGPGVGPHPEPWPDDPRLDPELLRGGDHRNVVDRYRYWSREAVVADLDARRHPFHVGIENYQHDFNIGSIVRSANAFLAAGVHIIGKRRWNRRGAMVTDRYQHVVHHPDLATAQAWAERNELPIVGVDILPEAKPIEHASIPMRCLMLFGQEGPGLSEGARSVCKEIYAITQYGSTRSLNVGVAAGIAMYAWATQHAAPG